MYNELDSIYENIYEYYINDYIIFEGILRRDYMECIGILTEDGNKNFLQRLWEKIKEFINLTKEKVVQLIKQLPSKLLLISQKHNVEDIIDKYGGYYVRSNDNDLDEFTMNNFKPFNTIDNFHFGKMLSKSEDDIGSFISVKKIDNNILEKYKNKINNMDDYIKKIRNNIWIDKEIKYPFKEINGLKKYISNMMIYCTIDGKSHNTDKGLGAFLSYIYQEEEFYKSHLKAVEKDVERSIKRYKDRLDDSDFNKKFIEEQIELEQNRLKMLPLLETLLIKEVKILVSECNNLYREIVKLYIAGGKYLEKKLNNTNESVNINYYDVLSEAAVYELN